jgi:hypothetical protein
MVRLVGFEQVHCAFEPNDLLDAFPVLAKPIIEIRTTAQQTINVNDVDTYPDFSLLVSRLLRSLHSSE